MGVTPPPGCSDVLLGYGVNMLYCTNVSCCSDAQNKIV